MGGVLVHIKVFKPHPIPHQSDVFTKGVWGQYAVDILGRTQQCSCFCGKVYPCLSGSQLSDPSSVRQTFPDYN